MRARAFKPESRPSAASQACVPAAAVPYCRPSGSPRWLEPTVGRNVYNVVWETLNQSKFSVYSEKISAVWFWKKLVLRGSTRDKTGGEQLDYFKGGFCRLADIIVDAIRAKGGEVSFGTSLTGVAHEGKRLTALRTAAGEVRQELLFTHAFSLIADMFEEAGEAEWLARLRRVRYLGNMCLVLRLKRSLSDIYWLNVNDPSFPFVGIIEHTNFDPPEHYKGSHIAFLSRYLPVEDPVWQYDADQYAFDHLKRMFPDLQRSDILEYRMWRSAYAQPVTERGYSTFVPGRETPFENAFISTMAQVYPEDRGTNYAIREGQQAADTISRAATA